MIKIRTAEPCVAKNATQTAPPTQKKKTASELRVQKEISDLALGSNIKLTFNDVENIMAFSVTITPREGLFANAKVPFSFAVPSSYPHAPPKVHCTKKIFHPNIDLDGNVCLNILREEWNPVLGIGAIIIGLEFLLLEPNPDDPLNKEAAKMQRENFRLFEQTVRSTLRGSSFAGTSFSSLL